MYDANMPDPDPSVAVTVDSLKQRVQALEDGLRMHRHTGFDMTQPLAGTTISRSNLTTQNLINGAITTTIQVGDDIQSSLDALHAKGGGYLYLQVGTYKPTANLTGYSSVSIIGVSPTATVLDFGNTNHSLSFAGTSVYSTGTITAVSGGVNVTGSGTLWLANVTAGQTLFLGTRSYVIAAVTGNTTLILGEGYGDNVTLPSSYRICTQVTDITIKNVGFKNSTGTALKFNDCRRITMSNTNFISNSVGYNMTNCSETDVAEIEAAANTSDGVQVTNLGLSFWRTIASPSNGGNGFTLSNMKDVYLIACSCDGNTGDGLNLTTGVNMQLTIDSSSNGGKGVNMVSVCSNVDLISGRINNNVSDGIKLTASSSNCHIYGNDIEANGGYGVNIAGSSNNSNLITTNGFVANVSGAVNDLGTGTLIRGNVGVTDNATSSALTVSITANENIAMGDAVCMGDGLSFAQTTNSVATAGSVIRDTAWFSQTFTTSPGAIKIEKIANVTFAASGGTFDTSVVTCNIYASSAGAPTGASLGSKTCSGLILNGNTGTQDIVFASPIAVSPSTVYCVVFTSGQNSNVGSIRGDSIGSAGTTGSANSGSTWGALNGPIGMVVYEIDSVAGQCCRTNATGPAHCRTDKFIGFAPFAVTASTVGSFTPSIISALSGLTAGSLYYLSNTPGALSSSAGTVSRKVGIATSATTLITRFDNP